MSTPRVLFVDHTASLGGAELYLLDVARGTPNADVVLFEDGPFRERLQEAGVPVTVLEAPAAVLDVKRSAGIGALLRALPALAWLVVRLAVRARAADVVYLNSQKALIAGSVAARLARRPVVWNLHDIMTADHFSDLNRRLAVFCANTFVDRVVVNSEATRAAFAASGGRAPTDLVYNGIDTAPFEAVKDTGVQVLRRELGLPQGAPVVGVFSRLSPWKGQDVLLDALADLPGVHALLVGDAVFGPDVAYADELRTQVQEAGMQERVHFLGFRDDVAALMRLVDVVAHTSTAPEPFGRVIVEGMLAGRPVVAANAGGAREIVRDRENGYLVPPGDAGALAACLRHVLTSDRSEAVAAVGTAEATERFSRAGMTAGVHRVIREVCSEPSPSASPLPTPPLHQ